MTEQPKNIDTLIWFLSERAKELNCLYKIEELLNRPDTTLDDICHGVIEAIPPGWQYPDVCVARITIEGHVCQSSNFSETAWAQAADIKVQDKKVGQLSVYYTSEMPKADEGPFLKEETKLLGTIAERLGHYLLYSRMKLAYQEFQTAREDISAHRTEEWRVALNFLRQTNRNLFQNISRRMLNFLSWSGVHEAEKILQRSLAGQRNRPNDYLEDDNRPYQVAATPFSEAPRFSPTSRSGSRRTGSTFSSR
jgi:pyruvate,water dikinase